MLLFVAQLSTTDKAMMTQPSMEDKATMTLKAIYNSPEKCRLRKQLQYQKEKYEKKIRGLQQTVRRRDKQVVTMKSIFGYITTERHIRSRAKHKK